MVVPTASFDHSQTHRRPTMILRTPLVAGHQLQLLLLPSVLLLMLHLLLCDAKTVNPGDSMQMQHHQMTAEPGLPEPRAYMPDAQHLDFVYHDHEELTRFLR